MEARHRYPGVNAVIQEQIDPVMATRRRAKEAEENRFGISIGYDSCKSNPKATQESRDLQSFGDFRNE